MTEKNIKSFPIVQAGLPTGQAGSPKDVFLNLLVIVALYMNAASFLTLLFQYINIYFPDPLAPDYYGSVAGAIRWAMATLIIVFPTYIYISRMLQQDYSEEPAKHELRVRRWLVHFTLFAAAVTIIGDLVTLVYNFLGGDLTARFSLKIASVLLVAVVIFAYYLRDLKKKWTSGQLKTLAWVVSAGVLLAIVAGFFTAGSPFKARLIRGDEQRVQDLQMIQGQIINYWQSKSKLPETLNDLSDDISGFRAPSDPETGVAYEYRASGKLAFELCGDFALPSNALPANTSSKAYQAYYTYDTNWDHAAGSVCFERTIDPELYKPEKPGPLPVR